MSRKSGEDQSGWQMPLMYAFVGEYGPFKAKGSDPIANTLVWLCNSGDTNSNEEETQRRHAMYPLAGPIQELLLSDRDHSDSRFTTVLVIDIHNMFESHEEYEEALAMEHEKVELTKKFGKKLFRLFQKLLLYKVTVVAQSELCPLLLKLYKALERTDASYNLEENNTVSELWLLHPELPAKYVNTHLVTAKNKKQKKSTLHQFPVQLNVVHTSTASNRTSILKPFFPNLGTELIIDGDIHDLFSIVANHKDSVAPPAPYCSERCNNLGKMLFMSHMKVEMNKLSKQYDRNCSEATSDLLKIVESKSNHENSDGSTIDWSSCERHVGALLLRGNRCILVRSVSREWEGMRIPSVVPNLNELPRKAAIRAVTESTGVDACELRGLPHVLPVALYAPNGRPIKVDLYPLYATQAPPDYGDDGADMEDEDDPYDWYTFPNAIARLDQPSVAALQSMALNLLQASNVGLVPSQWGGVFGQEFQLRNSKKGVSAIA